MADADVPIKYMDRTRHYYRALGHAQDYIWATAEAAILCQIGAPGAKDPLGTTKDTTRP